MNQDAELMANSSDRSPAAARMRLHRERRRQGLRCPTIEVCETEIDPIDAAIQSNLRETTTRVLASLTPREERIVRMRFGLGMNSDHTLEEVGQQFSLTRERIRQIEAKALRKLKHPSRSSIFRSFLNS
jgi:RNA polymerase sigma factor (sigma-70 family)